MALFYWPQVYLAARCVFVVAQKVIRTHRGSMAPGWELEGERPGAVVDKLLAMLITGLKSMLRQEKGEEIQIGRLCVKRVRPVEWEIR